MSRLAATRALRALAVAALALCTSACGSGGGDGPGAGSPPASAVDPPVASGATLTVMSYNMHWGGPSGSRLAEVADIIASTGAEVVGLQEVRRFARVQAGGDYGCQDQPALLAEMLEARVGGQWTFAFAPNLSGRQSPLHCEAITDEPRAEGVAILTRHSIRTRAVHQLPHSRAVAEARIDAPGGPVTVFTVHLDGASREARVVQAESLADLVAGRGGPIVLTGDMNGQPDSPEVARLLSVTRDAWAEAGTGDGRTRQGRIDYVLFRGDLTPRSAFVVPRTVSDHRPVVAEFAR